MSIKEHRLDLHDNLCLLKMDWITFFGKRVLPRGFWGPPSASMRPEDRHLYLTFDDGPSPDTTLPLLDLLDEEDIKATFFVMGNRTEGAPELVAEMHKRGHAVGNHTYSHLFLPSLSTKKIEHEIHTTSERIFEITGQEPVLFRPPFGLVDQRGAAISNERKMQTIYWGAVSEDWLGIGEQRVISRTMGRVSHGSLIVLHEGRRIAKQTIASTREIIRQSKARGYTFHPIPPS